VDQAERNRVLRYALLAGSLLLIGIGLALALTGAWFGWVIAAFGVIDAATIPFVARFIGRGTDRAQPPADPDYNPYARED
jgi:hypothetical protein